MSVGIFSDALLGVVAEIAIDVKKSETHTLNATPTNFAVESGATVSDHIVLNPEKVEISFEISNKDFEGFSYGIRAATIYQIMRQRLQSRSLNTVVTRHHLYTDMALIDLPVENTGPFNGRLIGKMVFQKINRPKLKVVEVPESNLPEGDIQKTASSTVESGRKATTNLNDAENTSLLKQITGSWGA